MKFIWSQFWSHFDWKTLAQDISQKFTFSQFKPLWNCGFMHKIRKVLKVKTWKTSFLAYFRPILDLFWPKIPGLIFFSKYLALPDFKLNETTFMQIIRKFLCPAFSLKIWANRQTDFGYFIGPSLCGSNM